MDRRNNLSGVTGAFKLFSSASAEINAFLSLIVAREGFFVVSGCWHHRWQYLTYSNHFSFMRACQGLAQTGFPGSDLPEI